jgi:hypothetical protein
MLDKELGNMALTAANRAEQDGFLETARCLRQFAVEAITGAPDGASPQGPSRLEYISSVSSSQK